MDRGLRITIAATLVLAGVTAAILLGRSAADTCRPDLTPGEQLVLREPSPPRETGLSYVGQARTAAPVRPAATVPASAEQPPRAASATRPGNILPAQRAVVRVVRHRIVDGDTLALLAQRYLGSADRQAEILEANRGVLSHADLLPIGAVLKIIAPEPSEP